MTTNLSGTRAEQRARLIHREIVQLLQLGAVAIIAFFLIRSLAADNRETVLRSGAEWYQRGSRELAEGHTGAAVAAFRRATLSHRTEAKYVLALADALSRQHQNELARAALLELRESTPESPQVNLQLARLAVTSGDAAEAVSYYHNTLYAPWRAGDEDERRAVRLELVDFLLQRKQAGNAVAELTALAADSPDTASAHRQLATRFAAAGDPRTALAQFQAVLRHAPADQPALVGAGDAAFALGEFSLARRYLGGVRDGEAPVVEKRDLVDLIIASDPLAPRLGAAERRRRLTTDLAYATARVNECSAATTANGPALPADLRTRSSALETELRSGHVGMDVIEDGLDVVADLLVLAARHCAPSPRDRALRIVTERHASERR
jgi:Flp pilus assembly protein TadD